MRCCSARLSAPPEPCPSETSAIPARTVDIIADDAKAWRLLPAADLPAVALTCATLAESASRKKAIALSRQSRRDGRAQGNTTS